VFVIDRMVLRSGRSLLRVQLAIQLEKQVKPSCCIMVWPAVFSQQLRRVMSGW